MWDIIKLIWTGDGKTRVRAAGALAVWIIAGSFLVSTMLYYLTDYDSAILAAAGGTVLAACASTIAKFV